MTADQTLLLTQVAFVMIIAVPSVVTIGVLVFVAWRFIPIMIKQMQQLIDNNAQLTKIAEQNAEQIETTESILASITPELVKQTAAIEAGNALIMTQGIDFRSYQTLVSDNLSNHSAQIETNTASIAELQAALADLPSQIVKAIKDEPTCETLLNEFRNLRNEVSRAVFAQHRSTGTFPAAPSTPEGTKSNNE